VLYPSLAPANSPPRTLFLGSYPPRECGIATFTRDVVESFDHAFGSRSEVVAIDEPGGEAHAYGARVVARLRQDDRASYARLARDIDAHPSDVLDVQHEYGLRRPGRRLVPRSHRGGPQTRGGFAAYRASRTEHRAQRRRAANLRTRRCGRRAFPDRQTPAGGAYGVDPAKLHVVHHGVPDVPFRPSDPLKARFGLTGRTVVSTFGLISRGKGLEYAIEAMRTIVARQPDTLYLILGQTHPGVRRYEGESYREELKAAIARYDLGANVALIDKYLDFDELVAYLGATDIYLTPYLNPVQIVSGTLAYAIGLGKAIVSTPYLYAEELLANGHGLLVPFRDPAALAKAVLQLVDDKWTRRALQRRAYRFGRLMTWPNVAVAHGRVFASVAPGRVGALELVRPA